jgi:hypothetical protein
LHLAHEEEPEADDQQSREQLNRSDAHRLAVGSSQLTCVGEHQLVDEGFAAWAVGMERFVRLRNASDVLSDDFSRTRYPRRPTT